MKVIAPHRLILELSKIGAGQTDCNVEPLDFQTVLDESLTMVQHLATQNDITINVEDNVDISLMADYMKLKQVLINLLTIKMNLFLKHFLAWVWKRRELKVRA
ncbi:hypothetical protein A9Q79_01225 [Methylophaga sp. 42_25_T18]|nr:hypothetical protein A9Q79_01225 [Methylophaga sp. 42_25_T18]